MKEKRFAKARRRTFIRGGVSFISIVVVALLCVSVFLALNYAAFDLERTASASISAVKLRDIELLGKLNEKQREPDETGAKKDNEPAEPDADRAALAAGERELAETQQRLEETGKELESSEKELEAARKDIEDSQARLEQTETELQTAKSELVAACDRLTVSRAELDKGKKELEAGWSELEDSKAQIRAIVWEAVEDACGGTPDGIVWAGKTAADADDRSAAAMDFWLITTYRCDLDLTLEENIRAVVYSEQITDEILREAYIAATGTRLGFSARVVRALMVQVAVKEAAAYQGEYEALQSACRLWDEEHAEYLAGLDAYRIEESQYQSGLEKYSADMAEYRAGLALLEAEKAQYEEEKRQYDEALAQYGQDLLDAEALRKELEESRAQLESGEHVPEDVEPEQKPAEDGLEAGSWLDIVGNENAASARLLKIADRLRRLGNALAPLFIPLVALVIFAAIRSLLGKRRAPAAAAKAAGPFTAELFWKYLIFGVSAALLGSALGIPAARFAVEGFILKRYDLYYIYDLTDRAIPLLPTLAALASAAALAVIAVWAACFSAARKRGSSDAAHDP